MSATLVPAMRPPASDPAPQQHSRVRIDIQGLRAVAVLAVVLYHAGVPFVPGGYVGVDVFFVVSGFLITFQLTETLRRGERFSFGTFYARRARRLLPMAALVATVTVVAAWVFQDRFTAGSTTLDALWTTFFGLNFRLAHEGVQYMGAEEAPSALQHYWSLAVEEQFYLVWPVLLLALTATWWLPRFRDRAGARERRIPWLAVVVLAAACLASYAWCIAQTETARSMAYFLTPARAWELGIGALLALTAPAWRAAPRWLLASLSVAGLAGIVSAAMLLSDASAFPGAIAAWPVLASAAVIAGGMPGTSVLDRAFAVGPIPWLGNVSYSWYLWHWPVLVLLPAVVGREPTLPELLSGLGLGLWLAGASHMVLEDPVRFLPSLTRPAGSAVLALGCTTVVLLAVLTVPRFAATAQETTDVQAASSGFTTAAELRQLIAAESTNDVLPGNLDPALDEIAPDQPYVPWADGESCMVDVQATTLGGECRVTDAGGPTVVVAGDSHAFQWMPALLRIARDEGWTLYEISKAGCALYDATVFSTELKRTYRECDAWRAAAMDRIEELSPRLVVTSAFVSSSRGADYAQAWNDGVGRTVRDLRAAGIPTVSIGDTPWVNEKPDVCLAENVRSIGECAVPRVQEWRDAARQNGTAAAATEAGAFFVDPTDWFCTGTTCPAAVGTTSVYHDQTHISATWAKRLAPVLREALEPRLAALGLRAQDR